MKRLHSASLDNLDKVSRLQQELNSMLAVSRALKIFFIILILGWLLLDVDTKDLPPDIIDKWQDGLHSMSYSA